MVLPVTFPALLRWCLGASFKPLALLFQQRDEWVFSPLCSPLSSRIRLLPATIPSLSPARTASDLSPDVAGSLPVRVIDGSCTLCTDTILSRSFWREIQTSHTHHTLQSSFQKTGNNGWNRLGWEGPGESQSGKGIVFNLEPCLFCCGGGKEICWVPAFAFLLQNRASERKARGHTCNFQHSIIHLSVELLLWLGVV